MREAGPSALPLRSPRARTSAAPPPLTRHMRTPATTHLFHPRAPPAGTSKINYMDPRITAAWCKAVECPIEKVFQETLRKKFPWAMSVPSTWKF